MPDFSGLLPDFSRRAGARLGRGAARRTARPRGRRAARPPQRRSARARRANRQRVGGAGFGRKRLNLLIADAFAVPARR